MIIIDYSAQDKCSEAAILNYANDIQGTLDIKVYLLNLASASQIDIESTLVPLKCPHGSDLLENYCQWHFLTAILDLCKLEPEESNLPKFFFHIWIP